MNGNQSIYKLNYIQLNSIQFNSIQLHLGQGIQEFTK